MAFAAVQSRTEDLALNTVCHAFQGKRKPACLWGTRAPEGPADPRPVNIDIGELIQEVATWHKETGGEREILFDPALAAGLPPISIAPGMLKLVLSNTIHHLMSNSSGGVLIRLKSEDEAIMILCSSRSAEPGVGIRSGPDTARVGADPGLPLSAELVAQLGGEMGTDDRGNVWVRLLRETSD